MMRTALLLLLVIGLGKMNAQDRVFTYTYQTNVLNKGEKELEVWTTMLNGRKNYYRGFEHRLEFETGLGGKLQTSFYLNYGYAASVTTDNGTSNVNNDTGFSFSNEWKYKLTDPVANRLGSALYFEYTLSPTESEFEGKIILDKQVNKLLVALNLVGEYAKSKEFVANNSEINVRDAGELHLEFNYGLAYKVSSQLNLGIELFDENTVKHGNWEYSVLWIGPSFAYTGNKFWINLTCMPQITNLKGGGLELSDHEKLQTRLVFSYAF